jgi:hypothetical protein
LASSLTPFSWLKDEESIINDTMPFKMDKLLSQTRPYSKHHQTGRFRKEIKNGTVKKIYFKNNPTVTEKFR